MSTPTQLITLSKDLIGYLKVSNKPIHPFIVVKEMADIVLPHYESDHMLTEIGFQTAMLEEIIIECEDYPESCQLELLELIKQLGA